MKKPVKPSETPEVALPYPKSKTKTSSTQLNLNHGIRLMESLLRNHGHLCHCYCRPTMAIGPYGCGLERFCAAAGAALIFIIQPCAAHYFWAISKVHHLLLSAFFNWWAAAATVVGVSTWYDSVVDASAFLFTILPCFSSNNVHRSKTWHFWSEIRQPKLSAMAKSRQPTHCSQITNNDIHMSEGGLCVGVDDMR